MGRIITRDELMAHLDLTLPARVNPDVLDVIIEAAEGFAETRARRVFAPLDEADTPITRTFKVRSKRRVRIPDLRESTAPITLDANVLAEDTDYEFDSVSEEPFTSINLISWTPYTSLNMTRTQTLSITGLWGFNPTPPEVKDAILIIAARRYRKRDAMYGDQIDTGASIVDYRSSYPKEALEAIDAYRIPQVAVV